MPKENGRDISSIYGDLIDFEANVNLMLPNICIKS